MNDLVLGALLGFVVGWGVLQVTLFLTARSRTGNLRSDFHHQSGETVPRLGGLALGTSFIAIVLFCQFGLGVRMLDTPQHVTILCGSLAMFGVGLWDDFKPLGAKKKLLLQIIIAHAVWFGGIQVTGFKNPFGGNFIELGALGLFVTALWVVATTNLINLIDGIDGLAGGIGLMVMALLAFLSLGGDIALCLMAAGVSGALVAFLRFNFPPARIYLGDGGAYFLGFLIGVLSIANSHKGTVAGALFAPLIALGLPIIDTALAILRRGFKGLPVFRADRRHIHHRLLQHGFSRRQTVLFLYGVSLVLALSAFGLLWTQGRWMPVLIGAGFLLLLLVTRGSRLGLDVMAIGRVVGNSTQMRDRVRYALALGTCLELEAEQGLTLPELWQEFCTMARKLGFSQVKLERPEGHWIWESHKAPSTETQPDHVFEFNHGFRMLLQFQADPAAMSDNELSQISELAAESWFKAAKRWHKTAAAVTTTAAAVVNETSLQVERDGQPPISTAAPEVVEHTDLGSDTELVVRRKI